jgi:hypothetical protein
MFDAYTKNCQKITSSIAMIWKGKGDDESSFVNGKMKILDVDTSAYILKKASCNTF